MKKYIQKKGKVLLLILAFNESVNIRKTLEDIKSAHLGIDILVVNDGSYDTTPDIAKEMGVAVLDLPYHQGISKAEQAGFRYAIKRGYDIVARIDADGQHDPREVHSLLAGIINGKLDLIIGSRFLGNRAYKMPLIRFLGVKSFSYITSLITKRKFTDTTSGFRVYGKKVLYLLAKKYPPDPGVETVVWLLKNGCKIKEVPITMKARRAGASHISTFRAFITLLKLSGKGIWVNLMENRRIFLGTVLVIYLLTSLLFLIFFKYIGPAQHEVPGSDYTYIYEPMARNIIEGKGILLESHINEHYVSAPPGYSFFLLPIFLLAKSSGVNELALVVFFNSIIMAIATCFLALIAQLIFNRTIGLVSVALWSIYPLELWFIKNPNTEVPFMFFLFLAIWVYFLYMYHHRFYLAFFGGIFLGIAIFIRPIGLFLPPLMAASLLFSHTNTIASRLKAALLLLVGSFLILIPWVWYASYKINSFVPISSLAPVAIKYGLSYGLVGDGSYARTITEDERKLMERIRTENVKDGTITSIRQEFMNKPTAFLKILARKLARTWYATYGIWEEGKIQLIQLPYLALSVWGVVIAWNSYKMKRKLILILLMIVFYFWSITFLTLSIVRYMVPAMAFLIVFAALPIKLYISRAYT